MQQIQALKSPMKTLAYRLLFLVISGLTALSGFTATAHAQEAARLIERAKLFGNRKDPGTTRCRLAAD
nr:hypothetical protein [Betaproteobacteria bacterium]